MEANQPIIEKGSVFAYRLFDIGAEIDLSKARSILQQKGDLFSYQVEKRARSLILNEKPLTLITPTWQHQIGSECYDVTTVAKLWSFGAISIRTKFTVNNKHFSDLAIIGEHLEKDQHFHNAVLTIGESIAKDLSASLVDPNIWGDYEDYLIYSIEQCSYSADELQAHLNNDDVSAMILAEKPMKFAQEITEAITGNVIRYSVDDLVLIHWNGALIYDPEDAGQVADTLEFALTQLLELRYYDHQLELQLSKLNDQLEKKPHSLLFNPYGKFAEKASLEYLGISEIVDRVGNSFKVVGDYYFASLFRNALEQFRVKDWRQSVDHKLASLAEISHLFKGEVNENRTLIMEFTIVVLIAIEVVPLLYGVAVKFFE